MKQRMIILDIPLLDAQLSSYVRLVPPPAKGPVYEAS